MKMKTTKLMAKAERASATAVLHERGLAFRKHTAVHAALAEHYTRTGVLDPKYHRWLLNASEARNSADYEVDVDFTALSSMG